MGLKDDLAERCHWDSVTVGQGQGLVVVKDGVQVLDPNGVDGTVKDKPHVLA